MILVDSSVGSKDLMNYPPLNRVATLTSLVTDPENPSSADVCITGNGEFGDIVIGIELCSVTDLVSKLWEGRLQDTQIRHLRANYHLSWILYFGQYRCGPHGQLQVLLDNKHNSSRYWHDYTMIGDKPLPYSYVEGFFVSPDFLRWNVSVKRVFDLAEAAAWIYTLDQVYQKSWKEHKCMSKLDNSSSPFLPPNADPSYSLMCHVAQKLPTIGNERCHALAEHFDCTLDMINAEVEELSSIETESAKGRTTRVGPVRAQAIYDALRRKKGATAVQHIQAHKTQKKRSSSSKKKKLSLMDQFVRLGELD